MSDSKNSFKVFAAETLIEFGVVDVIARYKEQWHNCQGNADAVKSLKKQIIRQLLSEMQSNDKVLTYDNYNGDEDILNKPGEKITASLKCCDESKNNLTFADVPLVAPARKTIVTANYYFLFDMDWSSPIYECGSERVIYTERTDVKNDVGFCVTIVPV